MSATCVSRQPKDAWLQPSRGHKTKLMRLSGSPEHAANSDRSRHARRSATPSVGNIHPKWYARAESSGRNLALIRSSSLSHLATARRPFALRAACCGVLSLSIGKGLPRVCRSSIARRAARSSPRPRTGVTPWMRWRPQPAPSSVPASSARPVARAPDQRAADRQTSVRVRRGPRS